MSGVQDTQHEASKRFRSELLTQLDGILPNHHRIFVLASTNSPWDLDNALLRRFDKRILVDMPDKEARQLILKHHMKGTVSKLSSADWEIAGKWTENYSGSDLRNLAKEVCMGIARERIKTLQTGARSGPIRAVCLEDVKRAVEKTRPSSSSVLSKKYHQWQNEHGALWCLLRYKPLLQEFFLSMSVKVVSFLSGVPKIAAQNTTCRVWYIVLKKCDKPTHKVFD